MARLRVSPTRSNLLLVRQRLRLAREGFELLDRKRDVLILEILRLIEDAQRVQAETDARFAAAYRALREARAVMGTERVRRTALLRTREVDVHITPRSVMGVVVPSVRATLPESQLAYGFGDTSVLLDQARLAWGRVLEIIGHLAEAVTTIWRLAFELRRTQRRVNALEHVFIPTYEETLRYIEEALEEKEREDLFRMKRAKAAIERRRRPFPTPGPDPHDAPVSPEPPGP